MITTEIIVSAMLEATDEINKSFSKMKPTISQAMEVVRTSMQLALGSTESVKNANTTLALSFIKLGGAIRKLIEGTGLGKLGDVLEKIAANIVPLVGSFVAFIVVFGTLTAATYAFGKALAFVQAMSKGNLVASLVKLSMVAASFFAASKTFDALGDKMKYLSNTTEDLAGVIRRAEREMEQLEEQSGEALDELQKISVVYRNISFEVSQVTLAIQELEKEQKKIESQMVSLEDKTKNTFRKIAYFIEAIIRGIFAGLNKIAIITLQSIADSFGSRVDELS